MVSISKFIMVDYGNHQKDVQDLVELAFSDKLLSRRFDPLEIPFSKPLIIDNFDNIELYRDPYQDGSLIEGKHWDYDIKWADAQRNFKEFSLEDSERIADISDEFESVLEFHLLRKFAGKLPNEEISGIAEDFASAMRIRAEHGTNTQLTERLLKVYSEGGYPCGWDGEYPEGRIVVFTIKSVEWRGHPKN